MPSNLLKMVHIERTPGTMTNMNLPTLELGKLRPRIQLVINIGSKRTNLPSKLVKSLCRPAIEVLPFGQVANGAMIQIDSLLGMMSKLTL